VTRGRMDPRLRTAVDANVGWYGDLFLLHGVPAVMHDGLWSAVGPPPPLHSDAVVVEPGVTASDVLTRLEGRARAGFKDSFAAIDASAHGMDLLFEATWIHRDAPDPRPAPASWSIVRTADALAAWTSQHDTAEVLLPGLLDRGPFRILAKRASGQIVAGAVARLGTGAVDVSNVYAVPGHAVDWAELTAAVGAEFPGRPLVGYERGDDLAGALAGGFQPVGDLRVWVR
jgi:hypothetical protein